MLAGVDPFLLYPPCERARMAAILNTVYSVLVLVVALGGTAYVFAHPVGEDGDSAWSRWGEFAAVAVFLLAMVATMLVAG